MMVDHPASAAAREKIREANAKRLEWVASCHRRALADPAYRDASGLEQYDALLDGLGIYVGLSTFYRIRKWPSDARHT